VDRGSGLEICLTRALDIQERKATMHSKSLCYRLLASAALLAVVLPGVAAAQAWPARPLHLILPYAAGGAIDTAGRATAAELEKRLQVSVVVENRPGASGTIGARSVARAEPDGYTYLFIGASTISPILLKAGFDVAEAMEAVSTLYSSATMVIVRGDLPIQTVQDLVAYSKANPDKLNLGVTSTFMTLLSAPLKQRTGITYAEIPYQGEGPALTALLGGQVDFSIFSPVSVVPYLQSGRIHPLFAIAQKRFAVAPSVPTAAEVGLPNYSFQINVGLWAPRGTPQAVIRQLNGDIVAALKGAELQELARKIGFEVVGSSPEEQLRTYKSDISFLAESARLANIQPQ
jgi:tripartite-type tricarboxylate transporter receptor subunit TctC